MTSPARETPLRTETDTETGTTAPDQATELRRPADLTDDALVAAFEGEGFAPGSFHHRDHLRVAWAMLERADVLDVLPRFRAGLRRLAERAGKPELYHETITWAYVLLVNERRAGRVPIDAEDDWPAFIARNPDLEAWRPSILEASYYREDTLWSDRARRVFVLPDRGAPHAGTSDRGTPDRPTA